MSITFTNEGHAERYLQKLWKKCENEELCDVVLIVGIEERRVPAHRSVLSEESEYFNGIFASMRESKSKVVKMPEVNGDVLQSLVEYCYKGRVVISEDIVIEMLKTAHMLRLIDVVIACEKFLSEQLHPNNFLGIALLAERYNCELLLEKTKEYSLENFMEISKTAEFLQLRFDQLKQLLACDELRVETEEIVFNSLKAWLQHDLTQREQYKVELMKLVRMPLLERMFLVDKVKPFCTSIECLQAYMGAMECLLLADGNLTNPRRPFQVWMGIAANYSNNQIFVHYYCPQQQKWLKCLKELEYRYRFGWVLMKNSLYIVGGIDAKDKMLNTVICLNLNSLALTEISTLNEQRKWCAAAALNGFLYVVGGYNGTDYLNSVEKWNSETNKWRVMASMSVSRGNPGIIVLDDKLYVVGGCSNGIKVNSAECYNPIDDVWQSIAPMSEVRQLPGVAVANGLLYAVGGYQTKTAEYYDPQTNKWTTICSLREELFPNSTCTTINGKVVVSFKDRFEQYDAASDEWKVLASVKHPENIYRMFSYPGKLLTSKFAQM